MARRRVSSRARRRSKQEELDRQNRAGYMLFGLVGLAAAIFTWWWLTNRPVPLDAALCPEDRDYPAQIAVLLDPSDPVNTPQSFVVDRIMDALDRQVSEMAEIKTFTVARAGRQDTVPDYRICKPVHPDSASWLEGAERGQQNIVEEYDDFQAGLRQSLSGVLQQPGDTPSPILEAIQTSVLSTFRPRDATTPRWLLIVSDMAQNSDCWTFYGDRANTSFRDLSQQSCFRRLRVDLASYRVTIYQLARSGITGRIQQRNLRQFWDDYFLDRGADTPTWVDVEG